MCVLAALRGQKRASDPRTGVMGGCELPCGCWKLNSGPLQEQVLLNAEPSFQLKHFYSSVVCECTPMFHGMKVEITEQLWS